MGLTRVTTRLRSSPAGRRSRSARPRSVKLHPTVSYRPRPASASSTVRRSFCGADRRPTASRRAGRVAGSFSIPSMRATSSIRSTSRVTSARRKCGTATSSPSGAGEGSNSSELRMSALRSRLTGAPRSRSTRSSRRRMGAGVGPGPPTSIVPGASPAWPRSIISRLATAWASMVESGESPFSKRAEASLRRPRRVEVRWMFGPTQVATSRSTRLVSGETSDRAPPMMPAIEVGPCSSQMITISESRRRPTPSSVSISSPSRARRTIR